MSQHVSLESVSNQLNVPTPPKLLAFSINEMKCDHCASLEELPDIDMILHVTWNKNERNRVLCRLKPLNGYGNVLHYVHPTTRGISFDAWLGTYGKQNVAVISSQQGQNDVLASQNVLTAAIHVLFPLGVIGIGVMYGRGKEQRIADVIVGSKIIDFTYRKEGPYYVEMRGLRTSTSKNLLNRFINGEQGWITAPYPGGSRDDDTFYTKAYTGPVLSGPVLVNNRQVRDKLFTESDAIGGEMEGIALYITAVTYNIEFILVKGISDWGDGHKSDSWQAWAADNAASYVEHVMSQNGFLEGFPDKKNHKTRISKLPVNMAKMNNVPRFNYVDEFVPRVEFLPVEQNRNTDRRLLMTIIDD
jgi:nucleoside phosphorylase